MIGSQVWHQLVEMKHSIQVNGRQELFTMSRYQYMFDLTDPNVLVDEWIDGSLEHDHE